MEADGDAADDVLGEGPVETADSFVVADGPAALAGSTWDGFHDLRMAAEGEDYDVAMAQTDETAATVALIAIRWDKPEEEHSGLWVALPMEAFPRKVADRPLASFMGLTHFASVKVPVCQADARDQAIPGKKLSVKLALLPQASLRWVVKRGGLEATFAFSNTGAIPTAEGLETALLPRGRAMGSGEGEFVSADSASPARPEGRPFPADLPGRVQDLEGKLDKIIAKLDGEPLTPPAVRATVPAAGLPRCGARAKTLAGPGAGRGQAPAARVAMDDLDPAALADARAAGVSEEDLKQFARVLTSMGPAARVAGSAAAAKVNEDAAAPGAASDRRGIASVDPTAASGTQKPRTVEDAVVMMAQVLERVAPRRRSSEEEMQAMVLGPELSSGQEVAGAHFGGAGRDPASVRLLLTEWLKSKPELIYGPMEARMAEAVPPGGRRADGAADTRWWMEHRSRVSSFRGPMTWGWCFAGIHNELAQVAEPTIEVKRARARSSL